jgi:hypothetical protein
VCAVTPVAFDPHTQRFSVLRVLHAIALVHVLSVRGGA